MKRYTIALLALFLLGMTSCLGTKQASKTDHTPELLKLMTGSFDSSAQAASDKDFYDITLHMYPIWQNREDGPWLYVEQAVSSNQEKPYRQRVYRLVNEGNGLYVSYIYALENPEACVGSWKDSRKWDAFKPENLSARTGCEVRLKRTGKNTFEGRTGEKTCESTLRGAKYATSIVEISEAGILSWDQGWDDEGNQVWGAEKGGYMFVKK